MKYLDKIKKGWKDELHTYVRMKVPHSLYEEIKEMGDKHGVKVGEVSLALLCHYFDLFNSDDNKNM